MESASDPVDDLRASIERTRAQLAATADAIARLTEQARAEPEPEPEPAPDPEPEPAPEPEARPTANLPVLYRPAGDTRRAVAIAGALAGALVVAVRLGRRFLR